MNLQEPSIFRLLKRQILIDRRAKAGDNLLIEECTISEEQGKKSCICSGMCEENGKK